ncbi:MAG: DEAD/DEAH box helicase, partial [Betaproteobacteria bacterium]
DVGIGKTIEAALIVRELLDRGEITRFAVLCPPHLAEQWQVELKSKFHLEAELVLPGTVSRLERDCGPGESLFELYPQVIVSMDFIKSDRRREEFVHSAPELVIVDEAHTCAYGLEIRGGRHQRHQLVKSLAADNRRHLILVTATPHSGKEDAFRSLLGLLRPEFADLPADLTGPEHEAERRKLAAYFIQRRRADIQRFLETETSFPSREEKEIAYRLTPEYRRLFERVLAYARETVKSRDGNLHRQRVRWWSALAMLRSLGSSPAAAAATLRTRAAAADTETAEEADEIGQRTVFDMDVVEQAEIIDIAPGGDPGDELGDTPGDNSRHRRRLLDMAREAERLAGEADPKLLGAVQLVRELVEDGYHPVVFCRFIPTADYVANELRTRLPSDVAVISVTGELPQAEREARVLELAHSPRRVLVATDCLSEGINLQEHFDAIMHYDLSWNPTRHEQREGRVDRYGQRKPTVRVVTYYGADNPVDGIVLDVLLRKHKTIRTSLGISVPVPLDTNTVVEAILEGLLLRGRGNGGQGQLVLPGFEGVVAPKKQELYSEWENTADREKRSRTVFAQESIKTDEVARELNEARKAAGGPADVASFVVDSLRAHGAAVTQKGGVVHFDLRGVDGVLRDSLRRAAGVDDSLDACFEMPAPGEAVYLSRTHPFVETLASHVMDAALDTQARGVARRAGAIRTFSVTRRTTLLLMRFRFDIVTRRDGHVHSQLAEECRILGFVGSPDHPEWLDDKEAERLLSAEPSANILPDQAEEAVRRVVEAVDTLRPHFEGKARERAATLLDAHRRVRQAARMRGTTYEVEPKLPPDVLGIYVYLPVPAGV